MKKGQPTNNKKNSSIADWPLEKRKLVAWIGIAVIMLILVIFWFYSLRTSFTNESNKTGQSLLDVQQIRQDLNAGLEDIKKGSQLLKKINIATSSTSSASTSPEMELLKEQNRKQLEELNRKIDQLSNQKTDK